MCYKDKKRIKLFYIPGILIIGYLIYSGSGFEEYYNPFWILYSGILIIGVLIIIIQFKIKNKNIIGIVIIISDGLILFESLGILSMKLYFPNHLYDIYMFILFLISGIFLFLLYFLAEEKSTKDI